MRHSKKIAAWMKVMLCVSIVGSAALVFYHGSVLNLYLQILQRHKLVQMADLSMEDLYTDYVWPHFMATVNNLFLPYQGNDTMPVVRLDISEDAKKLLNSDLPESGFQWVDGTLTIDGVDHDVEVKYAGDYLKNWMYYKKGYRVKVKKEGDTLFNGYTSIDIRMPKYPYAGALARLLGNRLGLLTQERQEIQLYLQNEFVGSMYMQEVLGKDFLEKNKRMAGDLYQGENGTTEIYEGVSRDVFTVPSLWETHAEREDGVDTQKQDLFMLMNTIQTALNGGKLAPLLALMDEKAAISFAALVTCTQSFHFDYFHNTILYFDPTKGNFEQVVKDVNPWAWDAFTPDVVSNDLFMALHKDPRFVFEKYRVIWAQIKQTQLVEWLLTSIVQINLLRADTVAHDPGLADFKEAMTKMTAEISKLNALADLLATTDVRFKEKTEGAQTVLTFAVSGWNSVELTDTGESVYRDSNMNGVLDGEDQKVTLPEWLHPGRRLYVNPENLQPSLVPSPLVYQYIFEGSSPHMPTLQNGLDGSSVIPVEDKTIMASPLTYPTHYMLQSNPKVLSVHPWLLEKEQITADDFTIFSDDPLTFDRIAEKFASRDTFLAKNPSFKTDGETGVSLKGTVIFDRTVIIPKDIPLTIQPGTTIALGPDVSIIAYGSVTIVGTENAPVHIQRLNASEPWGTFAVLGDQTQSVSINYASFDGGKDAHMNGAYFSGMVSLYWLKDVTIDHSIFQHSASDDSLNIKYTTVDIANSFFSENSSDAIDSDFNQGTVTNSTFYGNGGDAIDVSGTTFTLKDNIMQNSGDKGISVGEASTVDIQGGWIAGCVTGIAVKDASVATIQGVHLLNNTTGIALYEKKALYEKGGTAVIQQANFYGNGKDTDTDDFSQITMTDITNNQEEMSVITALPF